ncbi:calcium-transporting ATPase 13, plasma membrane-type [Dorcoceras hygrometricum]|uniref:Calcium-transporting ATPase 13, plasma membrane-type n=1 Tax=Dorcoceras hygrometricum TaxID=472368 RepID=A0A2Z7B2S7_9LAMI|nr:calcium-transporting ATPase 13, plasma membrane-type [Dorcoceras hygrometricum]
MGFSSFLAEDFWLEEKSGKWGYKYSVLVGDVALLNTGGEVPADGLVLEAYGDQSMKLTESDVGKRVETSSFGPFLCAGAKVVEGEGMIVTSVVAGKDLGGLYEITKFGAEINQLLKLLEILKLVLAAVSLLISLYRYFSGIAADDDGDRLFNPKPMSPLQVQYMIAEYIVEISVIFVAMDTSNFVGTLKICFAHAVNEVAACNVIVRSLPSWGRIGLGGATINVSDEFNASNRLITLEFLFVPQIKKDKKTSSSIVSEVAELIRQRTDLNTTGIYNHLQIKCT